MDTQTTLLEKVDLFQVIFIIHLAGLLIQPFLELIIPLYHPFQNEILAKIILAAWCSYLGGKYLMKIIWHLRNNNKSLTDSSEINIKILLFLIILQFIIVMSRYFIKGIPLFSASPDIAKGAFLATPTYGCTRLLYIGLPLSLFIYLAYQFQNGKKWFNLLNISILGMGLFPLFIGLFKGSVITFLLGTVLIYDKFQKRIRIRIKFRYLLLILLVAILPILQYYYSEGERNFGLSAAYVFQRLTVYSLEGFNYIVYAQLPPTWLEQLRGCLELDYFENPGFLLSQNMLGVEYPNFTTVTTLYGFCWRNGGWPTLVAGFILLGMTVQLLLWRIRYSNNVFYVPLYFCLVIVLLKTVLVGEPFNDLRGPVLSLLCAAGIFEMTKKKVEPHENSVS